MYKITKEECERNISGVCEGCGGKLTALETVDNSGDPTFWQGCVHCSSFRQGIEPEFFKVARLLVESGEFTPYSHMNRCDYAGTKERLDYYFDSQTAGASRMIKRIDALLAAERA